MKLATVHAGQLPLGVTGSEDPGVVPVTSMEDPTSNDGGRIEKSRGDVVCRTGVSSGE